MAPSTDLSASKLFGSGFSSVVSTGICVRFIFAYSHFCSTSSIGEQAQKFLYRYKFLLVRSDAALCVGLTRASIGVPVHCVGNLCKTFRAQKSRGICRSRRPWNCTSRIALKKVTLLFRRL